MFRLPFAAGSSRPTPHATAAAGRGTARTSIPAGCGRSFVAFAAAHLALAGAGIGALLAAVERRFFGRLLLRPRRAAPDLAVFRRGDRAALAGFGLEHNLAFLRGAAFDRRLLGALFVLLVPAVAVFAGRLVTRECAIGGEGR